MPRPFRRLASLALLLLATASPALALEPDEIALVCNTQVPASLELATFYAQSRGIPSDRIIELALPTGEEMSTDRLDPDVVMPIRKALNDRNLRGKVRCLVTFYGVPLKLTPRRNRPEDEKEMRSLQAEIDTTNRKFTQAVTSLEAVITRFDPDYHPSAAVDVPQMLKRAEIAMTRGRQLAAAMPEPEARGQVQTAILNAVAQIGGTAAIVRNTSPTALRNLTTAPATMPIVDPNAVWQQLTAEVKAANDEAQPLLLRRHDPSARKRLREIFAQDMGLVDTLALLQSQLDYLTPEATGALDNALVLLWMNSYSHKAMNPNPLYYRSPNRMQTPAIMVSRLDGPESGTGRDIVSACKYVESHGGLTGKFVIDSRGLTPKDEKGVASQHFPYDQKLRDLAALLRRSTQMPLFTDDAPDVIRPTTPIPDVAMYCGWYSVHNYVPAFKFVPGAIGFHVASYEMLSLHDPNEKGWCRGLLKDGIAVTLGPVAEPYLSAFPDPTEFFPLVLTGKYTVAEAYWLTNPMVAWKMVLIADPLYNPYKPKPALTVENLPQPLRSFVSPQSSAPEPLPASF